MFQNPGKKKSKTQSKPKLEKSKRKKQQNEHTCKKRENKTTNKRKKSKKKQHISTKKKLFKSHSNTLIQPLINPLSSPYSDLTEIFSNCCPVGCFKTPKKEKQNPIQT